MTGTGEIVWLVQRRLNKHAEYGYNWVVSNISKLNNAAGSVHFFFFFFFWGGGWMLVQAVQNIGHLYTDDKI